MSNLNIVKMMSMVSKDYTIKMINGKEVKSYESFIISEDQLTKDYIRENNIDEDSIKVANESEFNHLMGIADMGEIIGNLIILDDGLYNLRYIPEYDSICDNHELNHELVYFMNNEQMKKCRDLEVNRNFRNNNVALYN